MQEKSTDDFKPISTIEDDQSLDRSDMESVNQALNTEGISQVAPQMSPFKDAHMLYSNHT